MNFLFKKMLDEKVKFSLFYLLLQGQAMKYKYIMILAKRGLLIISAAFILLIFLLPFITSILGFSETDETIQKYFAVEAWKPNFSSYQYQGRQIHYAFIGNDTLPPLIFVHGSPGSWDNYKAYFKDEKLLQRFQIFAIDRPGFGKSDFGWAETNLKAEAEQLIQILNFIKSKVKPILVGHSLGGPVVSRMAMDFPEKVGALLILAGSIDPQQEKKEWFRKPGKWLGKIGVLPKILDVSNTEIMALKNELIKMLPLWNKIQCPVTVIHGTADVLVPVENAHFAQRMLKHNTKTRFVYIKNENHFLPWRQYDLVQKNILELAEKITL